jgi:UDPglucose 6-dehydrogenase
MNIIIAGYGFVGKAVANTLKSKHNIHIVDPKYTSAEIQHFPLADGIIICVGTPSLPSGVCDSTQICNVLDQVPIHIPVLIKSTMTPPVIEALETIYKDHSICYSPEFLRQVSADEDFANQKHMVIGGEDPEGFWQDLFSTVLTKCNIYFNCSMAEASMIKYTANSFLATKVAFFNQIYDMCQANGCDYRLIRQVLTHDTRIGNSHMLVPGPDGERGFGGACFPKDTKAFRKYAYGLNKPITVLDSAIDYNKTVRKDVDNQQN